MLVMPEHAAAALCGLPLPMDAGHRRLVFVCLRFPVGGCAPSMDPSVPLSPIRLSHTGSPQQPQQQPPAPGPCSAKMQPPVLHCKIWTVANRIVTQAAGGFLVRQVCRLPRAVAHQEGSCQKLSQALVMWSSGGTVCRLQCILCLLSAVHTATVSSSICDCECTTQLGSVVTVCSSGTIAGSFT